MRRRAWLAAPAVLIALGIGIAAVAALVLLPPAAGARPAAHPTGHRAGTRVAPTGSPMLAATPTVRQPSSFPAEALPAPGTVLGAGGPPPAGMQIPAIGLATSLGRVGLKPDGTIMVPSDFGQPAWFQDGPAPGAVGPAVIIGHLDSSTGPAVFYRLNQLHPGDRIVVTRQDGSTVQFHITRIATFAQDAFPTDQVYGPTSGPALRLITCGGRFNWAAQRYSDNVVAFAAA